MRIGRKWWCHGCKVWHPLSREIEGQTLAGDWCRASILRAKSEGRNAIPYTHEAEQ